MRESARTGAGGKGLGFMVLLAVLLYVLFSAATAIITVKDCDPYAKHWNVAPPRWECESGGNVSPN